MGKLVGGPFGQLSGKTGDLVGGSWKGIATIKRYQPNVANPQTAGQVAQRNKMSNVVAFAQSILAVMIKPLWDRFQSGMSGYNAFVSRNIDQFSTAVPSSPSTLVISAGKMAPTAILTAVADSSSANVILTWANDSGQGFKLSTDKVYVAIVDGITGEVEGFAVSAIREDAEAVVAPSFALVVGHPLHCYLAFLRADGSVVSTNSYSSTVVVA